MNYDLFGKKRKAETKLQGVGAGIAHGVRKAVRAYKAADSLANQSPRKTKLREQYRKGVRY